MTNQTHIISTRVTATAGPTVAAITADVNDFVTAGKALGYMNFHILPVNTLVSTIAPNTFVIYTVQINYYNPAVG